MLKFIVNVKGMYKEETLCHFPLEYLIITYRQNLTSSIDLEINATIESILLEHFSYYL